jgi:hypothetical protein
MSLPGGGRIEQSDYKNKIWSRWDRLGRIHIPVVGMRIE